MLHATEADIARFMSYVDKLPNGCWFWAGARSRGSGTKKKKWYGSFRVGRQTVRAHRFSCEVIGKRPCPLHHHRDHICKFSLCVNPDHLEIVHHTVNMERRWAGKKKRDLTTSSC